jgi:putative phosphoribosyl transferase
MTTATVTPLKTTILTRGAVLTGDLRVPESAVGAIVCAHAGWTDLEPRAAEVTDALWDAGFATLWLDLVVPGDEEPDVPLLAGRLVDATRWLRGRLGAMPIAFLGAGTAASAALWAAAGPESGVFAVVSLGGWPDPADAQLALVQAPTLLVVGGVDGHVLELNRGALAKLPGGEHALAVVPGATHYFEQYETLLQATALSTKWFLRHV